MDDDETAKAAREKDPIVLFVHMSEDDSTCVRIVYLDSNLDTPSASPPACLEFGGTRCHARGGSGVRALGALGDLGCRDPGGRARQNPCSQDATAPK